MNSKLSIEKKVDDPRIVFFDGQAATWDSDALKVADTLRRLENLRDLLGLCEGEELLEVGCGTGQITAWLTEAVRPGRVTAVDFSKVMLERARAKNIDADFRRVDICADRLDEGLYDVILCFHSFPHFRDKKVALANMARALKPGGRLLVMHLAGLSHINALHDRVGGAIGGDHVPDESAWPRLLAQAGLLLKRWVLRDDLFFVQAEPI